jgi:hypothetical protein
MRSHLNVLIVSTISEALSNALSHLRLVLLRLAHHHHAQLRDPITAVGLIQHILRESAQLSRRLNVFWLPDPALLGLMGRMLVQVC